MTLQEAKDFLQYGDIKEVADNESFSYQYTSQVLRGKANNIKIKTALLKKAVARREEAQILDNM